MILIAILRASARGSTSPGEPPSGDGTGTWDVAAVINGDGTASHSAMVTINGDGTATSTGA